MDQMMLDVSEIECDVGDEVVIFGSDRRCSANAVAEKNETINYEIICAVGERVPRAYVMSDKIYDWQDGIYNRDLI